MSLPLNKSAYTDLVSEDIEWVKKSPDTLERRHIIEVLKDSIQMYYPEKFWDEKSKSKCD